jgi:hypothetical protein
MVDKFDDMADFHKNMVLTMPLVKVNDPLRRRRAFQRAISTPGAPLPRRSPAAGAGP